MVPGNLDRGPYKEEALLGGTCIPTIWTDKGEITGRRAGQPDPAPPAGPPAPPPPPLGDTAPINDKPHGQSDPAGDIITKQPGTKTANSGPGDAPLNTKLTGTLNPAAKQASAFDAAEATGNSGGGNPGPLPPAQAQLDDAACTGQQIQADGSRSARICESTDPRAREDALSSALPVGLEGQDHIVLGRSEVVEDFSAYVGGRHLMGSSDWQSEVLTGSYDGSTRFSVNLDGVEGIDTMIVRGKYYAMRNDAARIGGRQASPFDWEMYILSESGALDRTTFYRDGRVVPSPFR
jgi:hypothetical protein